MALQWLKPPRKRAVKARGRSPQTPGVNAWATQNYSLLALFDQEQFFRTHASGNS